MGLLAGPTKTVCNEFIACGQAGTTVHQEKYDVSLFYRLHGLPGHFKIKALLVTGKTAGVYDDEALALVAALTVFAVTGKPRKVRNQGIPGTGHLIK